MKILVLIIAIMFMGCGNEKNISFVNIEDHLQTMESLNSSEKLIAENILKNAKDGNYKLISTKELNNALQNGENMEIIATIPRGIYILGFIKGAKNFEFQSVFSGKWENDVKQNTQEKFISFLGDDKNKKIIFYDNGENSAHSGILWAKNLGYRNIYLLVGNFRGWKERNLEISFDMPECCQM